MGLLDDIQKEPRVPTGRRCGVAIVMALLTKKERDDLHQAIDDITIPSTIIQRVLNKRDIKITAYAINRHRRGECVCE